MKQAMIFAAGLGTRLKPLTDRMPKALVRVGGEPLLKHVVLKFRDAGFDRIVVNVHHFAGQIIDYLQENGLSNSQEVFQNYVRKQKVDISFPISAEKHTLL